MEVSIPGVFSVSFSHQAMVLEVTALWGFMIATNRLVSSPLIASVLLSYSLRASIGHSSCFSEQDGKKKLCMGFPCLDCFARFVGKNSAPTVVKDLDLRSSFDRSADLEGRVSASSMTVFQVSCCKGSPVFSLRDSR